MKKAIRYMLKKALFDEDYMKQLHVCTCTYSELCVLNNTLICCQEK